MSECISADDGYYFIKCISRIDEELTEANRQAIIAKTTEASFDKVYEEYLESLYIEVNEDVWDKLEIENSDGITSTDFFNNYNEWF